MSANILKSRSDANIFVENCIFAPRKKRQPMKRILPLFLLCISLATQAQDDRANISFDGPRQKDFGGFILDMGTMLNAESLVLSPILPTLSYLLPDDGTKHTLIVNPDAVRLNTDFITFGGVSHGPSRIGTLSLMHPGYSNGPVTWQGASYLLNNGIRINTYGEYDADGYKVYNPAALPWQKNNFNAAFEVKSPDGKFGIKLEVTGGRCY